MLWEILFSEFFSILIYYESSNHVAYYVPQNRHCDGVSLYKLLLFYRYFSSSTCLIHICAVELTYSMLIITKSLPVAKRNYLLYVCIPYSGREKTFINFVILYMLLRTFSLQNVWHATPICDHFTF